MSYKMLLSEDTQNKLEEIAPKCQELFSGDISKDLLPERKQAFIELAKIARSEMQDHYGMISKDEFIKAMKEYGIPGKAASLAMEAAEYKSWKNRTPEEKAKARKEIQAMIDKEKDRAQLKKHSPSEKLDKDLQKLLDDREEPVKEKAVTDKELEYLKRLAKEMDEDDSLDEKSPDGKKKNKEKEGPNAATLETRQKTLAANIAAKCRSIGMEDEECAAILTNEMGFGANEAQDILDDEIPLDDIDVGYKEDMEQDFFHEWVIAMLIRYEQEVKEYEEKMRSDKEQEEELELDGFSGYFAD